MLMRLLLLVPLVACSGTIGNLEDFDGGPGWDSGVSDSDPQDDSGFTECGETGQVIIYLEERCGSATCHGAGGQFPLLTRDGIAALTSLESEASPGQRLVVPGDAEASWLYRKMSGTQGEDGGALMPLGTATPSAQRDLVASWINDGASVSCDVLPPTRLPYDPNSLDQDALFQCADPSAPRSSPSRLRRIERQEFTHARARSLNGTWWGSTVKDNPLSVPEGLLYSTYAEGLSLDPATLDLYMLYLDEAAVIWSARDTVSFSPPGVRLQDVYTDRELWCIQEDAAPDDACIDPWVEFLLTRGVLFRAPTLGERSRLKSLVLQVLADEGGDFSRRQSSLHYIAQAALLMKGALFRDESGDPADNGRLSDDDLALALGHVVSTYPVGTPLPLSVDDDDPDSASTQGRLGAIREAALDGSIQDPSVRRALIRQYGSGISQARPDIGADGDGRRLALRGRYWLAPGFARFFREFFDYTSADTAFKDQPGATSQWDGTFSGDPAYDPSNRGFRNGQPPVVYGYESTLAQQLDDTIARVVIESDASGEDVFEALMTTRRWRVPSNLSQTNGVSCTSSDECSGEYAACSPIGLCGSSIAGNTTPTLRPYNLTTNTPDTDEGRWVDMPSERLGVLTHPAWLAAHGGNFEDDASLVHRGKWIREALFCETVPPLELVMVEAQLIESDPANSARERVAQSIETGPGSEVCMGCHRLMNPLGVAFETFNHAGFVRAEDHGVAPSGSTQVDNLPDPALNRAYAGPAELVQALAQSSYARRGFVRHAFRYFMGRDERSTDGCTLTEMEAALLSTGSFFAMVEALVSSETFSHRQVEEEGAER